MKLACNRSCFILGLLPYTMPLSYSTTYENVDPHSFCLCFARYGCCCCCGWTCDVFTVHINLSSFGHFGLLSTSFFLFHMDIHPELDLKMCIVINVGHCALSAIWLFRRLSSCDWLDSGTGSTESNLFSFGSGTKRVSEKTAKDG